ncbi:unnamed protein product, partial [Discosporangium mesarthrocarpum]
GRGQGVERSGRLQGGRGGGSQAKRKEDAKGGKHQGHLQQGQRHGRDEAGKSQAQQNRRRSRSRSSDGTNGSSGGLRAHAPHTVVSGSIPAPSLQGGSGAPGSTSGSRQRPAPLQRSPVSPLTSPCAGSPLLARTKQKNLQGRQGVVAGAGAGAGAEVSAAGAEGAGAGTGASATGAAATVVEAAVGGRVRPQLIERDRARDRHRNRNKDRGKGNGYATAGQSQSRQQGIRPDAGVSGVSGVSGGLSTWRDLAGVWARGAPSSTEDDPEVLQVNPMRLHRAAAGSSGNRQGLSAQGKSGSKGVSSDGAGAGAVPQGGGLANPKVMSEPLQRSSVRSGFSGFDGTASEPQEVVYLKDRGKGLGIRSFLRRFRLLRVRWRRRRREKEAAGMSNRL